MLTGTRVVVAGTGARLAERIAEAAERQGASVTLAAGDEVTASDALFDGLDVLVVALAGAPLGRLHEVSSAEWECGVTGPLRRAFRTARRGLEEFLACGKGGRMVFAIEPPGNGILEASAGSLTRSIAREYGRRGVACSLVRPAGGDRLLPVVRQVLFLASPAASFVTGETLAVRCDR